jgi:uncharacterized membrane protein YozB (DUF420 family)
MELTTLSYFDLIIQIAILIALVLDYFLLRKENLKRHGALMTSAFAVNTVLIVAVMLPPFLGQTTEILENVLEAESLLFLSHHVLGFIVEILGGFLVLRWVLKAFNESFCRGKTLMRVTIGTWLVSILLGIVLFAWHLG